ncbi:MAG: rod shape-determining protein RodA [Solirubrobacterales bacterium]
MIRRAIKIVDRTFVTAIAAAILVGLFVLASASSAVASSPWFYLQKQLIWVALGLVAMFTMAFFDLSQLNRYYRYIYALAIVLLAIVLVFGTEVRGSQGWINVGGQPFQPAEIAKLLVILAFAGFLNKRQGQLNTLGEMIPCFLFMGFPWVLVMLQPDLGTGLAFLAILFGMMFIAGANPRIMLTLIVLGAMLAIGGLVLHEKAGMPLPLADYQVKRLTVFTNPYNDGMGGRGAGWNTIQSLVAVGSGGLFGKGLFHGTQSQLNFLPEQHTDFIFAVLAEELGFVGAAFLLLLYAVIISRALHIGLNARDFYSTLVGVGLVSMWMFHVFENIGMSIGLMPITGVPLPFISYGGSFMITNMMAVGLLLQINIQGKRIVF